MDQISLQQSLQQISNLSHAISTLERATKLKHLQEGYASIPTEVRRKIDKIILEKKIDVQNLTVKDLLPILKDELETAKKSLRGWGA